MSNPFGQWSHGATPSLCGLREPDGKRSHQAAVAVTLLEEPLSPQRLLANPVQDVSIHLRPNLEATLGTPPAEGVACVERDLDSLLPFFQVPEAHWKKVRTTNVIERAFREGRRRTRPMSSFSNLTSCDRIVFGVVSHLNRSWERKPLPEFTQNA